MESDSEYMEGIIQAKGDLLGRIQRVIYCPHLNKALSLVTTELVLLGVGDWTRGLPAVRFHQNYPVILCSYICLS